MKLLDKMLKSVYEKTYFCPTADLEEEGRLFLLGAFTLTLKDRLMAYEEYLGVIHKVASEVQENNKYLRHQFNFIDDEWVRVGLDNEYKLINWEEEDESIRF